MWTCRVRRLSDRSGQTEPRSRKPADDQLQQSRLDGLTCLHHIEFHPTRAAAEVPGDAFAPVRRSRCVLKPASAEMPESVRHALQAATNLATNGKGFGFVRYGSRDAHPFLHATQQLDRIKIGNVSRAIFAQIIRSCQARIRRVSLVRERWRRKRCQARSTSRALQTRRRFGVENYSSISGNPDLRSMK